jgi:ectoine hydroxylase-related dioxygenase (phytanoyl-CoA dioxygenase family)
MNVNWSRLSLGERIRQLEIEGFVLLPNILPRKTIAALVKELSALSTTAVTYSDKQQYVHHVQWLECPHAIELVALRRMREFLETVLGDELICTGCTYARTEPGYPGMALHTDSQPYGSSVFGLQSSAPIMLRVLYYLSDLTAECAPLRVVPYSHLCLHSDAHPYRRYKSNPQEEVITCKAGTAAVINQKLFHAVGANRGKRKRHVFAVSYRPAWAGPISEVPEHDRRNLRRLPPHVRDLFKSPNTRKADYYIKNYSEDMATEAPRLGPLRWQNNT